MLSPTAPPAIDIAQLLRAVHWDAWAMADYAEADEIDGARLLNSVREALLGYPDLGSRPRVSFDQWSGLNDVEKRAYRDVGITAIRRFTGYGTVVDQLRVLGHLRYEPAVDVLTGLREDFPVEPIRIAAAHALFSIGTSEARNPLRAGIDECEHFDRFMAVKTMFTDEGMVWDNVGWLFSSNRLSTAAGIAAADDALRFLSPSSFSRMGDRWHLDEVRDPAVPGSPLAGPVRQPPRPCLPWPVGPAGA